MSKNVQTFIDRLQKLPEDKREAYAAVYLDELGDDARWEKLFAETNEKQWRALAREMKERKEAGDATSDAEFLNK